MCMLVAMGKLDLETIDPIMYQLVRNNFGNLIHKLSSPRRHHPEGILIRDFSMYRIGSFYKEAFRISEYFVFSSIPVTFDDGRGDKL